MGDKDVEHIESENPFASVAESREKKSVSFKEDPFQAYSDWLERTLGHEAARQTSEKIFKLMLEAESKWQIGAAKMFLKSNSERGDEYFDKTREVISGIVEGLPNHSLFQEQGVSRQAEIQRWLIATYVRGFLRAVKGKYTQFDASIKGIAWSLLARDAKSMLEKRGQTIDSEWLFNRMGPLMRSNTDSLAIEEELSKFTFGNPQIIHTDLP